MLLAEGRGWYCCSARGAASSKPRATPGEFPMICTLALKARLTGRALELIPDEPNRAFTSDIVVLFKFLGRRPRLLMMTAPLGLTEKNVPLDLHEATQYSRGRGRSPLDFCCRPDNRFAAIAQVGVAGALANAFAMTPAPRAFCVGRFLDPG